LRESIREENETGKLPAYSSETKKVTKQRGRFYGVRKAIYSKSETPN